MKVVAYLRVSTKEQNTAMQLKKIHEYCQFKDWTLAAVYEDHGISGAKDKRPELDKLKKEVEKGKIDTVLVYKFDRLARSSMHLLNFLNLLGANDTDFVSVSENIDTSTPMGKCIFTFLAALAEYNREDILQKVRDGIARAKADGVQLGRPRKGFDVSLAIKLRNDGWSYKKIAKELKVGTGTIYNALQNMSSDNLTSSKPDMALIH